MPRRRRRLFRRAIGRRSGDRHWTNSRPRRRRRYGRSSAPRAGAPRVIGVARQSNRQHRCRGPVRRDRSPGGSYVLTVTRNGYASLQFGQQRPFEPGRVLELANGQLIDRVDFALPRGGVITGRVTDQLGEPVAGVSMQAMRYHYLPGGERQLGSCRWGGMFSMVTNDLGEFRVSGLMPGTYVLSANPDERRNDEGL